MAGVLVIDDDAAIRSLLVELLTSEGHGAYAAVGEAAVALALERQPDLIFLDLMMPELDGFAIIQRLQAHPRTRALPIVVMSASSLLRDREAWQPVRGYLPKPFDLGDVLAWVERVRPAPSPSHPPLGAPELGQRAPGADEAGAGSGL